MAYLSSVLRITIEAVLLATTWVAGWRAGPKPPPSCSCVAICAAPSCSDICDLAGVANGTVHDVCAMGTNNPDSAGSAFYAEPTYQTEMVRALAPRLVTLTIGGDDIGFAEIVTNCLKAALNPVSLPCRDLYVGPGGDLVDQRIHALQQPMEQALFRLIDAVGDPSKIALLTYPSPINTDRHPLCTDMLKTDRVWLRPKVGELDSMLVTAAYDASTQFDPLGDKQIQVVEARDAFNGHEACSSDPYITSPDLGALLADGPDITDNFYHPNATGYAHLEQRLAAVVPGP